MSDIDPEKLEADISRAAVELSFAREEELTQASLYSDTLDGLIAAARAYLATLPRYKEVEVWRVEGAQRTLLHTGTKSWHPQVMTYETEAEAREIAALYEANGTWKCTRITGPHKQRVPA